MTPARPTPSRSHSTDEALATRRSQASPRIPLHLPPLPAAQSSKSNTPCPCGGACPRCAPSPATLSSLVRSATEETAAPLPSGQIHRLQSRFRQTLPNIWIHRGKKASQAAHAVGARAFATGPHIVLSHHAPDLQTDQGFSLLIHETAHVLQQQGLSRGQSSLPADRSLEQEAIDASHQTNARRGPADIRPNPAAQGTIQREEPSVPQSALNPFTSQGLFQLQLDPEIEREIFRLRFRAWMALSSPDTQPASEPSVPSPDAEPTDASSPKTPPAEPSHDDNRALDPSWTTPDLFSAQPDIGALLSSFSARGVAAGPGDVDIATQLFHDRYRFVQRLPDLRAIVPDFARSWVPSDWRVKVAQALTNMTIDSALKHDNPTFIEASDQLMFNLTGDPGVVPTYIMFPAYNF